MKKLLNVLLILLAILSLAGCRDAEIVSHNLSKDADQFKILRRIVFYNSIQDKYILEMIGNCSIYVDSNDSMLEVTCKLGEDHYQKHFLGLSDNVTYTVEQLEWSKTSEYQYEIVFKPESILPITVDIE